MKCDSWLWVGPLEHVPSVADVLIFYDHFFSKADINAFHILIGTETLIVELVRKEVKHAQSTSTETFIRCPQYEN